MYYNTLQIMPVAERNNISVLANVFDKAKARFEKEDTGQSFVKWISDYLMLNLEKDEFLMQYAPNLHKIGITGNVLYIKDSKKNKIVEIRMTNGKLVSSDDDPLYLHFAMALPELVKLKREG